MTTAADQPDLTAFLHARFDDDAAEIAKHPDDDAYEAWDLSAEAETNYPCLPYLRIGKLRALAEVDAKRRILDVYKADVIDVSVTPERPEWIHGRAPVEAHTVLRLLAMPYASHPDYREEWRPA